MFRSVFRRVSRRSSSPASREQLTLSTRFRPNVELLETRVVPASAAGNGPVVEALTSLPGSMALTVTFDGPLDLPTGSLAAQFQLNQTIPGSNPELITTTGTPVSITSAVYTPGSSSSSTITLSLGASLAPNVFYRLFINGTPTLSNGYVDPTSVITGGAGSNSLGITFDGDNDAAATGNFYAQFGVGTSFNFTDLAGDQVSLSNSGPGAINLWRELNGDIDQLSLVGPVTSATTLNGSIVTAKGSSGLVYFGSANGFPVTNPFNLNGATSALPSDFITQPPPAPPPGPPPPVGTSPSPIVANATNFPYSLTVQPVTTSITSLLPGVQSGVYAQTDPTAQYPQGLWVIFGGRTNGLHNFVASGVQNFPPDSQNLDIFVINPANFQVLADVPWSQTDVPLSLYNSLISSNQQHFQNGDTLYTVGGYSAPIAASFTGSTMNGSPIITNIASTAGLQVGQTISAAGIPIPTVEVPGTGPIPVDPAIIAVGANSITLNVNATATATGVTVTAFQDFIQGTFTGDTQQGSLIVKNVSSFTGLADGQLITGAGIAPGSTIATLDEVNNEIIVDQPATATATTVPLTAYIGDFTTHGTLTSLSVSGLANALINGTSVMAGAQLQQTAPDSRLQVTGGEMEMVNGVTYLVVGQNFEGGYNPTGSGVGATQTYTDEIRSFVITNNPLGISNYQALRDPVDFRRRDYNLGQTLSATGQPGLSIFGGVFTPGGNGTGYGSPILIDANGNATVNADYQQFFNQYTSAHIPLFDSSTGQMITVFLGGIGLYDYPYPNGPLTGPDYGLPWIDDVTSFVTNANGSDQEYVMPPIPGVNGGTGFYGANAAFFMAPGLPMLANGVINYNALTGPTILGYMYGGIYSQVNQTGNPATQSGASNQVFEIILVPGGPSRVGVVEPGASNTATWVLNTSGSGVYQSPPDHVYTFGLNTDQFITGDWTGTGQDNIGIVRNDGSGSLLFVLDTVGNGVYNPSLDAVFHFGAPGDQVIVGDWTGTGHDYVGVYRPGANGTLNFSLATDLTGTTYVNIVGFGFQGDQVVLGDWTGSGTTKLGVVRPGANGLLNWSLALNANASTYQNIIGFGVQGDQVFAGNWQGPGADHIGVARPNSTGGLEWSLATNLSASTFIDYANFGAAGDHVYIGDWSGTGSDKIGTYRFQGQSATNPGTTIFSLDNNGDGIFDSGDQSFAYGLATDLATLVGKWQP